MIKLRCLVVDDEPIARAGIGKFILRTPFLECVAEAAGINEAKQILTTEKIDLLFLDIEMPGQHGISFLKDAAVKPNTIIITAHPQFAVEGFELNVVDYLLKPVSYDRFLKAVNKVRNNQSSKSNEEQHLFLKSGTSHEKVLIAEIDYIEAKGNYLLVHTQNRSIMTYLSLHKAEELLPQEVFLKVHKSYIVNINKITRIESAFVWLYNKPIPLSRSLKEEVTARLLGSKHNKMEEK